MLIFTTEYLILSLYNAINVKTVCATDSRYSNKYKTVISYHCDNLDIVKMQ